MKNKRRVVTFAINVESSLTMDIAKPVTMSHQKLEHLIQRYRVPITQSTSSILEASSAAPSTSSSGGKSSSMDKPSLIMRWVRPANCVGSSRLKPEVNNEVSKSNQIKSFTVLSDLSAAAFFLSSVMMECLGLTSMVFLETM